jgi:hypothetical protein
MLTEKRIVTFECSTVMRSKPNGDRDKFADGPNPSLRACR